MDRVALNNKLQHLDYQQLRDILANMVDTYCIPSFGSMSKHDIDLLMFDSMVRMGVISDNPTIYDVQKAFENVLYRMPSSALPFISQVQKSLLEKVQRMNCMIESCPTSNLIIGPFERYNELPIMKFFNTSELSVSINTDTKGIFATSLYEEYSLMAVSMRKDGMDMNSQIIPLMKRFASNGKNQLFEPIRVS